MVTHIDGVRAAVQAGEIASDMFATDDLTRDGADAFLFTAMMRAYLDARGLVMVPKEPTEDMLDFGACHEDQDHDIVDEGEISRDVYKAMLAAAPDPFQEASE